MSPSNKETFQELESTTAELLQTISSFTREQFNTIPFEGSWTAAQVAEHVLKAESAIPKIWQGMAVTTHRQPDEKVKTIQSIFLDFDAKFIAREPVIPSNAPQEKEALFDALEATRTEIIKLAHTINLTQTFTDFPFPTLGELTGIEWTAFIISHSKRHIRQLKNIFRTITQDEASTKSFNL